MDLFDWCDQYDVGDLIDIEPIHVATSVEMKGRSYEPQSVKQQLATLSHLFDCLVTGQVFHSIPACFERRPKHSSLKGKTPIMTPDEAQNLIRSIPTDTVVGLRDRAVIGLQSYPLARVGAALKINVKDVYLKQESL